MGNNNNTHKPTADVAIEKAGGPVATARLIGVHRSIPYKWMTPKEQGGTGGVVPVHHQEALINSDLGITPDDFWQSKGGAHGPKEKD